MTANFQRTPHDNFSNRRPLCGAASYTRAYSNVPCWTNSIKEKVSLGDGDSPALFARIRAHGNYVETAPFALIGLFALAMMNAHSISLHIFGAVFLLSKVVAI